VNLALSYNIKHATPSRSLNSQNEAEFDSPETIAAIQKALESEGYTVYPVEAEEEAYSKFLSLKSKISIVFNIAEGLRGQAREAQIPAMLEMLNIPYTHSGVLAQAITLDKALTKKILTFHKINTPKFILISQINQIDNLHDSRLEYPLIVKPNSEGSSKGIFNENLVFDKVKLAERIRWLLKNFPEPVLVEEYLGGREFTVSVFGNNPPQVLPIVEQNYAVFPENMSHFTSYEAKWLFEDSLPDTHDAYFCPPQITSKLQAEIENICLSTWEALNLKDVARFDLRIDRNGAVSILEVNTLPGLIPDPIVVSYLPIAARAAGFTFDSLVNGILNEALNRYGLNTKQSTYPHFKQKPLQLTKSK